MPGPEDQQELPLVEGASPWHRMLRESAAAYRAFLVYLELGPTRTVGQAYRKFTDPSQGKLDILTKPEGKYATGCWKRWAKRWRWAERAAAWEVERGRLEHADLEAERRERLRKRLEVDEIVFKRILNSHTKLDQLLAGTLGVVEEERETQEAKIRREIDNLAIYGKLHETTVELEDRYFGLQMAGDGGKEGVDPNDASAIPVKAEFSWVPDPEMDENLKLAREVADKLAAAVEVAKPAERKDDAQQ